MSIRRKTKINIKIMKKIKLEIVEPFFENEDYRIYDENGVLARTYNKELAIIIKNSLEKYINKTKK